MSRTSRHADARGVDAELVEALRAGDEAAFAGLIRAHHSVLLGVAMTYVSSRAVAEEVVQETWLGVLNGLDRFEGRSSLKTWIFKIAANLARTRAGREWRCRPFSSLDGVDPEGAEPSVEPDRFFAADHAFAGHWARPPVVWQTPEERLLSSETRDVIRAAIAQLPPAQRLVLTMRDVEGWSAGETCEALGITDANQRVLLHRARCKARDALERHLGAADAAA
jgi:RNA polymerase sigma-70 factor (ECF subfamily)